MGIQALSTMEWGGDTAPPLRGGEGYNALVVKKLSPRRGGRRDCSRGEAFFQGWPCRQPGENLCHELHEFLEGEDGN